MMFIKFFFDVFRYFRPKRMRAVRHDQTNIIRFLSKKVSSNLIWDIIKLINCFIYTFVCILWYIPFIIQYSWNSCYRNSSQFGHIFNICHSILRDFTDSLVSLYYNYLFMYFASQTLLLHTKSSKCSSQPLILFLLGSIIPYFPTISLRTPW